jgi:hypothetical protein
MKFYRTLSPSFIAALNNIYASEKSWWRTIVDDKDIFILIRNNEVRVQASGGLLLQINQSTTPIKRVEGLKGFVNHYAKIKRRINIFTGKERQAVQYLANNIHQIVDIEIGFEGELKENAGKKSVPRIDMAAITDNGTHTCIFRG